MFKILAILMAFTLLLSAETFECTLYGMDHNKSGDYGYLYPDEIKIYFKEKDQKLTQYTAVSEELSFYAERMISEDKEDIKIYVSESYIVYAIYDSFKGGVRVIGPDFILDASDCCKI